MPQLNQLRVVARRLAHCVLERCDVRHLRPDVTVYHAQAVGDPLVVQQFRCSKQLGAVQTELRVVAPARRPLARAARAEPQPDPDEGFQPFLACDAQDLVQLFEFLDDQNHPFAQAQTEQCEADELRILVPVAYDERLRRVVDGKGRHQLRFRPSLEPELELAPGIDDLLHNLAQLVHLDREHTLITGAVPELLDRVPERKIHRAHPVPQQVLEPDEQGEPEPAFFRLRHDAHEVDVLVRILVRVHQQMAVCSHAQIPDPPPIDVVRRDGVGDAPGCAWPRTAVAHECARVSRSQAAEAGNAARNASSDQTRARAHCQWARRPIGDGGWDGWEIRVAGRCGGACVKRRLQLMHRAIRRARRSTPISSPRRCAPCYSARVDAPRRTAHEPSQSSHVLPPHSRGALRRRARIRLGMDTERGACALRRGGID